MSSPFRPPAPLAAEKGVFGDHATLRTRRFLYRVIEFRRPLLGTLVYSGWWFRQKIEINGKQVWWKVSWLNLSRDVSFSIPASAYAQEATARAGDSVPALNASQAPPLQSPPSQDHGTATNGPIQARIEIQFTRGLRIRRFRIWFDGTIAYDEID